MLERVDGVVERQIEFALLLEGFLDGPEEHAGVLDADHLIAEGFVPEHDVYLAFSGGEEVNGAGAPSIVDHFHAKGIEVAKKHMITVSLSNTTIPHEVIGEAGAGRVLMKPASAGTGIIAGGPVRAVLEAAGIKDIRSKCLRSNNPQNVVAATFEGLKSLKTPEEVARIRGKSVEEIQG